MKRDLLSGDPSLMMPAGVQAVAAFHALMLTALLIGILIFKSSNKIERKSLLDSLDFASQR